MSEPKKSFHEVIAGLLSIVSLRMTQNRNLNDLREVSTLLYILKESKMPASAAHKIAEANVDLSELVAMLFGLGAADNITVILQDLRSREDEVSNQDVANGSR